MNVGMIGYGVVGSSTAEGLSRTGNVRVFAYDKYKQTKHSIAAVVSCDVIFVCVPTPMKKSGEIDVSALYDSVDGLIKAGIKENTIIVIKSTAVSGTTDALADKYPHLNFAFNPEFLTEINAKEDFINSTRVIIGAKEEHVFTRIARVYEEAGFTCPIVKTDLKTAEMIKYVGNTFLATKVMFANEIYKMCELLNIEYKQVIQNVLLDDRIGDTHWDVPGYDGNLGFGGKCFPKDLNALIYLAREYGHRSHLLEEVWRSNLTVRKNIDWLNDKGEIK